MSEKLSSTAPQEANSSDLMDSVKDFVTVDAHDKAHVPGGSGQASGNFLSDHEVQMIAAHRDQIEDGLEPRTADYIVNRIISHDGQNEITDPAEMRDALVAGLDDLDLEDYTDEEIMQFVADKRQELAAYNGSKSPVDNAEQEIPASETKDGEPLSDLEQLKAENAELRKELADLKSQIGDLTKVVAELAAAIRGSQVSAPESAANSNDPLKSEKASEDEFDQNDMDALRQKLAEEDAAKAYEPKHRAEFSDTDSPLFEEVKDAANAGNEVARDGESQEEFEARQPGKHRGDLTDEELLAVANGGAGKAELSDKDLEAVAGGSSTEADASPVARSVGRKWRDRLSPTRAYVNYRAGRVVAGNERSKNPEEAAKKSKVKKALAAVGLFGAGLGVGYLAFHGNDTSGLHDTINGLEDQLGNAQDALNDKDATIHELKDALNDAQQAGGAEHGGAWTFGDGSGGLELLRDHGIDSSVWYSHEDEFLQKFPELAYRMQDGHVGLIDQSGNTTSSELSRAAQAFWEQKAA